MFMSCPLAHRIQNNILKTQYTQQRSVHTYDDNANNKQYPNAFLSKRTTINEAW